MWKFNNTIINTINTKRGFSLCSFYSGDHSCHFVGLQAPTSIMEDLKLHYEGMSAAPVRAVWHTRYYFFMIRDCLKRSRDDLLLTTQR